MRASLRPTAERRKPAQTPDSVRAEARREGDQLDHECAQGFLRAGVGELAGRAKRFVRLGQHRLPGHQVTAEFEQKLLRHLQRTDPAERARRSRDDRHDFAGKRIPHAPGAPIDGVF